MALLWNGDLETGNVSQYGNWEYGGTQDGTPPLSERAIVSTGVDGVTPAQGTRFLKVLVAPGDIDGNANGWRTLARQHNPIQTRSAGYDSAYVMCIRVPAGYPGDATMWLCGVEMHGTQPVVANHHVIFKSTGVTVDLFGGIADDNLKTEYLNTTVLSGYAKDAWHVLAFRYRVGVAPNGHYELWHGRLGTDTGLTRIIFAPNVGTVYSGGAVYPMFFMYRARSGASTVTAYFDAFREYSTLAEAQAFATAILQGGGGSPPPPAVTEANVGPWTTPRFVNSRTATLDPTSYGSWTTPLVVHANNPAPSLEFLGMWTTPQLVASAGLQLSGDSPDALTLAALTPGSLTLTPHTPGAL